MGTRSIYEHESPITIAYRRCIHEIALALTNDTSMINDDINAIFELEQRIAKNHWTMAEQRTRIDESIHTTLGNLSRTLNVNSMEIIMNIRNAFVDMVQQSSWMDPISKSKAIEKAYAMIDEIGYPDYLSNDNLTRLETDYAEYNFNLSLMSNELIILRLKMKKNVQILREPVDRRKWVVAPTNIDATYTPEYNRISIGTIIGHEITHGFDDFGRKYDKDGNRILWWTNETIKKFNERKQCIINQYDQYRVTLAETELKINGSQTQGENIADISGLKEAFFAYQNWVRLTGTEEKKLPGLQKYSSEQLFFINFGSMWCSKITDELTLVYILQDVHSLAQFRVHGSTSNFVEFDRVFNCKLGQGNSRVNKCSIW
ncbi:unnamed protein product [Rotaria sp. Silwood1]|nr:unnamed protein product [Rotaria sp. Silwood1]CAF4659163.1 unnamed protein product [Rotaria sp. Silwood1]